MNKIILLMLVFLLMVACANAPDNTNTPESANNAVQVDETPIESNVQLVGVNETGREMCYFDELHKKSINSIGITQETVDYEKIKAVFIYIIQTTSYIPFDNEVITSTWRSFDTCDTPPTFYEELATGVLQYGIGSCENYASALVFLLEGLGMEAKYVPGATYSVNGEMVKHAWAMVKFNGHWYHIDPQLEDNISKSNIIFKYFMKDDITFSKTHLWGEALPNPTDYDKNLPKCEGPELIAEQKIPLTEHNFYSEEQAENKALTFAENAQSINSVHIEEKTPIFPQEFPD